MINARLKTMGIDLTLDATTFVGLPSLEELAKLNPQQVKTLKPDLPLGSIGKLLQAAVQEVNWQAKRAEEERNRQREQKRAEEERRRAAEEAALKKDLRGKFEPELFTLLLAHGAPLLQEVSNPMLPPIPHAASTAQTCEGC